MWRNTLSDSLSYMYIASIYFQLWKTCFTFSYGISEHNSSSETHQPVNFSLTVWCGTGRGPNHLAGLGLGQLLDAALAWNQVADLKKSVECLLLTT